MNTHALNKLPSPAALLNSRSSLRSLTESSRCTDPSVLANEIDYAPATVALLNMGERERRHLGPPQAAAEKDS
jgi:hypothetical protein